MAEETTTKEKAKTPLQKPIAGGRSGSREGAANRMRRPGRRMVRRQERTKSEYDQKIVGIRRVARVMAGGRRFSFSVAMILGNRKGKVGVGVGKAADTALAIEKAIQDAKKNMIEVITTEKKRIPHETEAKYSASEILIKPAPGRGLVAGSSVRTVLELAGVTDVTAKVLSRSKNRINNARAAIVALKKLKK